MEPIVFEKPSHIGNFRRTRAKDSYTRGTSKEVEKSAFPTRGPLNRVRSHSKKIRGGVLNFSGPHKSGSIRGVESGHDSGRKRSGSCSHRGAFISINTVEVLPKTHGECTRENSTGRSTMRHSPGNGLKAFDGGRGVRTWREGRGTGWFKDKCRIGI